MSKLFSQLNQEAQEHRKMTQNAAKGRAGSIKAQKQKQKTKQQIDVAQSSIDVAQSPKTINVEASTQSIQWSKLQTIIAELSEIQVMPPTTVRLSEIERQDFEDFIFGTLRKRGLRGNSVSIAKIMRYSSRYMMKV